MNQADVVPAGREGPSCTFKKEKKATQLYQLTYAKHHARQTPPVPTCPRPRAGFAPRVLKRTMQTALVWTLYEELVPGLTKLSSWAASLAVQKQQVQALEQRRQQQQQPPPPPPPLPGKGT